VHVCVLYCLSSWCLHVDVHVCVLYCLSVWCLHVDVHVSVRHACECEMGMCVCDVHVSVLYLLHCLVVYYSVSR